LAICHCDFTKAAPDLLADILDRVLEGQEPNARLPDSWGLGKLCERLESWEGMDPDRLIQMEFALVPALGFDGRPHLKALYEAITSRLELFAELVCLAYRPDHREHPRDTSIESEVAATEFAYMALGNCRRQPGTAPDGSIDADACIRFVDEARELCRKQDRLIMGDQTLGQILAHAPVGEDGIWPGQPARDILNRPEMDQVRCGFFTGAINKRGMTIRSPYDGGDQERALAQDYRHNSTVLQSSHPCLAATLDDLARSYEAEGRRKDDAARLQRERY
jgi:hypothetical protein